MASNLLVCLSKNGAAQAGESLFSTFRAPHRSSECALAFRPAITAGSGEADAGFVGKDDATLSGLAILPMTLTQRSRCAATLG
jgi:hypothetical protein